MNFFIIMPGKGQKLPLFQGLHLSSLFEDTSGDDSDSEVAVARAIAHATPHIDLTAIPRTPSPQEEVGTPPPTSPRPPPPEMQSYALHTPGLTGATSPLPPVQLAGVSMPDYANVAVIPPPPPPPPIVIEPVPAGGALTGGVPRLQHITNHMRTYITPRTDRPGLYTVEVFVEHHFYVEGVGMISLASRASRVVRPHSNPPALPHQ